MAADGILIYGALTPEYKINPVTRQLLSKAFELKPKIDNQIIRVCVIGARIKYDDIINELGRYGADEVIIISDDRLKDYDSCYFPEIFYRAAEKYYPRIILCGADIQGKEIAAYTAAKFNTGLTADCTGLDITENGMLLASRPTFGGKLTADILCRTYPQMSTVQENVFKEKEIEHQASARFEWFDIDKIEKKIEVLNVIKKSSNKRDILTSDIVIAGGSGACRDNGFALIYQLAQKMKAAIGGSREAFEKGYITKSQQIGQTGKTIAPKLYIAAGISGALQHLAGIKNSGKIIAVNKDKDAPVFKYADYGIQGDLFEILQKLIDNYDNNEEETQWKN